MPQKVTPWVRTVNVTRIKTYVKIELGLGNRENPTTADAARVLGMSRKTLDHIVREGREPSLRTAVHLQEVVGIPCSAWITPIRGQLFTVAA